MSELRIIKRDGTLDTIVKDGVYLLKATITIENGQIKYIDNGNWILLKEG